MEINDGKDRTNIMAVRTNAFGNKRNSVSFAFSNNSFEIFSWISVWKIQS